MPTPVAMLFAPLFFSIHSAAPPAVAPTTGVTQPAEASPDRTIVELTNAELISRLPPARQEVVYDPSIRRPTDNRFSVEWGSRIAAGKVTPDELGAALRQCGMIRSSPTWFAGEPFFVWMRMPDWLPGQVATAKALLSNSAEIRTSEADLSRGGCGNAMAWQESQESRQCVGILPPGTREVVFKVEIAPSRFFGGAKLKWSGEITLPVEVVAKAPPAPIDTPELTALIQRASQVTCPNGFFKDGPAIWLNVRAARPLTGPLTSTLMCFKAELLKDGAVVATQLIDDPDEAYGEERMSRILSRTTEFTRGELARSVILRKGIDHYTVRISGVAPSGPNQWCRTQYWSGSFTVPLAAALEPEAGMRPAGLCGPDGT